jgi:hypothetical protein
MQIFLNYNIDFTHKAKLERQNHSSLLSMFKTLLSFFVVVGIEPRPWSVLGMFSALPLSCILAHFFFFKMELLAEC